MRKKRTKRPDASIEAEFQAAMKARKPGDDARDSLPEWPTNKPLPHFKTEAEELAFYEKWNVGDYLETHGREVPLTYEPRGAHKAT